MGTNCDRVSLSALADRITACPPRWFHDVGGVAVDNFGISPSVAPLSLRLAQLLPAPRGDHTLGVRLSGRAPLLSDQRHSRFARGPNVIDRKASRVDQR